MFCGTAWYRPGGDCVGVLRIHVSGGPSAVLKRRLISLCKTPSISHLLPSCDAAHSSQRSSVHPVIPDSPGGLPRLRASRYHNLHP
jgi:hypothetical protein